MNQATLDGFLDELEKIADHPVADEALKNMAKSVDDLKKKMKPLLSIFSPHILSLCCVL